MEAGKAEFAEFAEEVKLEWCKEEEINIDDEREMEDPRGAGETKEIELSEPEIAGEPTWTEKKQYTRKQKQKYKQKKCKLKWKQSVQEKQ